MSGSSPDVSKMRAIKEVDRGTLPKEVQEQTDNLLVIRRDTLEQLGVDKNTVDKLLQARVAVHHKFMTCGDYNL